MNVIFCLAFISFIFTIVAFASINFKRKIKLFFPHVLALLTLYFISSLLYFYPGYVLADGEVKNSQEYSSPLFLFKDQKVSPLSIKTADNPYMERFDLSIKSKDNHTFNLSFQVHGFVIQNTSQNELNKLLDGRPNVVDFEFYRDDIKSKIQSHFSKYTKDELHSKLFVSEELAQLAKELNTSIPFLIQIFV